VATRRRRSREATSLLETEAYRHPKADSPLRPDVGTQPPFRKKKLLVTYRYDWSLSLALEWDGQSSVREPGKWLIGLIETAAALPPPHVFDRPRSQGLLRCHRRIPLCAGPFSWCARLEARLR
jgi:hypothetical protein